MASWNCAGIGESGAASRITDAPRRSTSCDWAMTRAGRLTLTSSVDTSISDATSAKKNALILAHKKSNCSESSSRHVSALLQSSSVSLKLLRFESSKNS